ncbi:MAG: pyruvate kinase [Clostridia bacterium]|nr:pyruvate kinase [Clostridia bacterium]
MKKTKIIGTIGPASIDYEMMKKLVLAGLNVVRINLSHAKLKDMDTILKNVKKLRKELGVPLPIMIDTRGPELRVKTFKDGSVEIKKGQQFVFTASDIIGDETKVSINMPEVVSNIKAGDKILAVNGLLSFKVVEVQENDIVTKAQDNGILSNRKSLFVPGVKLNTAYLNDEDKKDILWGIKNKVELIAASFVNSKEDVKILRKFIEKNGGNMQIISKIESQCGVDNLDEIIEHSDAIMVARGDLGVEVKMERLPELQKQIIKKTVMKGKTVITATEMLESMIENRRPTRAEVTDVANAVYDGSSCVMLSGETANGKNPELAVKMMAQVCVETEKNIKPFNLMDCDSINTIEDVVSQSAVVASNTSNIKAIVAHTNSGVSAGLVSRFRPQVDIIAATPNEVVYRQMELRWGVKPVLTKEYNSTDEMFKISSDIVKKLKLAKTGDAIVITCGTPKKNGGTNLIKIDEVK